ncbi:MAG: apolipoprotein N-acyltransferase [Candidatus Omnitrophica bacterium]|nr:apolipoprotein N-acyltransferase [Candidatus Omnitrophota bacterium]
MLEEKITTSSIFKSFMLAGLSGLLLAASFPYFNCPLLAYFAFIPLFVILKEERSFLRGFLLGFISGIVFWTITIYWLIHVTLLGTMLLIPYLAFYTALFSLAVVLWGKTNNPQRINIPFVLFSAAVWVILEYLRSHLLTGFPWALVGFSQYQMLPIVQLATTTGVWGVSFFVILVNGFLFLAFNYWKYKKNLTNVFSPLIICLVCVIGVLVFGWFNMKLLKDTFVSSRKTITVAVIQGNIPQELKWQNSYLDMILEKHLHLSLIASEKKPILIIWPEASVPTVVQDKPQYLEKIKNFCRRNRVWLLVGAVQRKGENFFNSALLISPEGVLVGEYDKNHLVPFGEYVPLRNIFKFLDTIVPIGEMTKGKELNVLKIFLEGPVHPVSLHFGVLICFEDLFSELARGLVLKKAEFLVNITNDAWYKKTSAAEQHLQASVFRAIENRIWLVRSANTGVSAFIEPSGKIHRFTDKNRQSLFVEGIQVNSFPLRKSTPTFYVRFGDWFIGLCVLIILGCGLLNNKRGYFLHNKRKI